MRLRAGDRVLELGGEPLVMGVINATPDSFSDLDSEVETAALGRRPRALRAAGADILDIGGESGITGRPAVAPDEEIARVTPIVEAAAGTGALVSVDTYKPAVARAAIAAGAHMVNDVSGLADPALGEVCADTGAALVIMHTRARPKQRRADPGLYEDVAADVRRFLVERMALARRHGVAAEQIVLDPGPDFSKTPRQTLEALSGLAGLAELGRPILLAVSRKDFVGALTGRPPRDRLAGTLAAIGHGLDHGAHILRVHDVAEVRDYLTVRRALRDPAAVDEDLILADALRHQRRDGRAVD